MQILYVSFKHLYYYESNTSLIEQNDEMNADIVRVEAGVIQNKLKNISSKLLNEPDIDSNIPKYILLRQCIDLEKKNYARSPSQYNINSNKNNLNNNNNKNINIENNNNENNINNNDIIEFSCNSVLIGHSQDIKMVNFLQEKIFYFHVVLIIQLKNGNFLMKLMIEIL